MSLGSEVQAAAKQDGWTFVSVDGKFGWINSDFLSTTRPDRNNIKAKKGAAESLLLFAVQLPPQPPLSFREHAPLKPQALQWLFGSDTTLPLRKRSAASSALPE